MSESAIFDSRRMFEHACAFCDCAKLCEVEPNNTEYRMRFHTVSGIVQLYEKKAGIETASGVELDWRELPDRKMSCILYETKVDYSDKDKWNEQFAWIMEYSVKIAKAFKKYL